MPSKKDISLLEKHAQTILTGLVAGLIGWVGINVSNQGQQIAVLTEQIRGLQEQVTELKIFAREPRFTKEDFSSLMQPYIQRIESNQDKLTKRETWMQEVNKRLNALEHDR